MNVSGYFPDRFQNRVVTYGQMSPNLSVLHHCHTLSSFDSQPIDISKQDCTCSSKNLLNGRNNKIKRHQ